MKKHITDTIGLVIIVLLALFWSYGFGYISYEEKNNRYDVNQDGKVDDADYMAIKKYIMEEK